jgi:hypothetical protein
MKIELETPHIDYDGPLVFRDTQTARLYRVCQVSRGQLALVGLDSGNLYYEPVAAEHFDIPTCMEPIDTDCLYTAEAPPEDDPLGTEESMFREWFDTTRLFDSPAEQKLINACRSKGRTRLQILHALILALKIGLSFHRGDISVAGKLLTEAGDMFKSNDENL